MIIVLGSGVIGLSSAICLRRAGYDVEIWAQQRPPRTTSNVAAAFWLPFRAEPRQRVIGWSKIAYQQYRALAHEPLSGVTVHPAFDLSIGPLPRPWWAEAVPVVRQATLDELPRDFGFGWVFDGPVIDTRRYLPYLLELAERLGIRTVLRRVGDLAEPLAAARIVVNCTGLGARSLCRDERMLPIRGQLLHISNPGINRVLLDEHREEGVAYIVPRGDDCVLGGTTDEGDETMEVRPSDTAAIIERCARLAPEVARAPRLADVVGLRPGRTAVRLELDQPMPGRWVVHNYGHGGAGVTLCWGCADEVTRHVQSVRAVVDAQVNP